ncbi:MAG TPA: hypothetical protein VEY12_10205 [Thermoplasmata archaeon]|nr:hypothetical protein [Thermoplasmata archaeon]
MTEADDFLAEVRAAMFGMEARIRDDILRELASHIAEATASRGDVGSALAEFGPARQVGREYRRVYGFGKGFVLLFAAVAFLLAIPSAPVLQVTEEFPIPNVLAFPLIFVLVAWVLWVSVAAGSRAGLLAGLAGFGGRIVVEVWLALTPPFPVPTASGLALFLASGLLLLLVGWLPGTAKKAWSGPSGNL